MNRREVLATMGTAAVAGCPSRSTDSSSDTGAEESDRQADSPDGTSTEESDHENCVSQIEYEELREEHEDLEEQYQDLRERALVPPYITTGQRRATVTFEKLSGEIGTWTWDSSALTVQNTQGSLVRELSYSQMEYLDIDLFGFEGDTKYQRLEDFGPYYQLNPFVIASNFTPLAEEFYNENQTDAGRAREAWNFVTQLNDYVEDIGETP